MIIEMKPQLTPILLFLFFQTRFRVDPTMNGSVIVSTKSCSNAHAGAAPQPPPQNLPQTSNNGNTASSTMSSSGGGSTASGTPTRDNSHRAQTVLRDPPADQSYDVTRMREDEFERLAVYIVPDVACERGVPNRADQTLPRSLTLKPSLVLSTPSATVSQSQLMGLYGYHNFKFFAFTDGRRLEYWRYPQRHPFWTIRRSSDSQFPLRQEVLEIFLEGKQTL